MAIIKCGNQYIDADKLNDDVYKFALEVGITILLKRKTLHQDMVDNLKSSIIAKKDISFEPTKRAR